MCLVVLSFFRDMEAATALADTVAAHNGVLGAAVCCAEDGGKPEDDWTTCEGDRDELLDRWAAESVSIDFVHCKGAHKGCSKPEDTHAICEADRMQLLNTLINLTLC